MLDINIINTIELFQQYLKYVPMYDTSIDDIIQRNGWIDERYVDNGICRIGNKRLVYDANSKPVIRIVDLTGISQMVPGVRRQKMKLTLLVRWLQYIMKIFILNILVILLRFAIAWQNYLNEMLKPIMRFYQK